MLRAQKIHTAKQQQMLRCPVCSALGGTFNKTISNIKKETRMNPKTSKTKTKKQPSLKTDQEYYANNAARAACDTFRDVMDAAGYKNYILVAL